MSKAIIALMCIVFMSCSKNKSPRQLAMEVCDCFKRNNHVSLPEPEAGQAQNECSAMQLEAWKRFGNSSEKRRQYHQVLYECSDELMKKALEPLHK